MKRGIFLFLVCFCLVFSGVVGASEEKPRYGGTLVFGRGGDSVGLDPAFETDGNSFMVCDNVYEQLVAYADESTDIIPGLAESWEISADGLTYTFHLRKGVKFHDGTDFNADAVVFSLGRQMKEKKVKFYKTQWEFPKDQPPPEYWLSMNMDDIIDSIEAVDEYTVVFKLKRPEAPFLANLGMDFASIVSPSAVLKYGPDFKSHPVGTGPFKFVKWIKDDRIILEANENYWDGRPYLDRVIFRVIPDNSVRFLELKTGNIHICQFPNPEDIALAKKDPNLKLVSQPGMNIGYISFNHTKPLWQDKRIRKAIAYAINRKAIVDNIYYGLGTVAKNTIPPIMWGYNDCIIDYPYDPEMAKKLLEEAKFFEKLKEAGQTKITLWSMPVPRPYNPNGMKVGEAVQADLKKVGIDVELVTFEWGTYLKKQREQDPSMDLFQLGWTGDNGDPDNFLSILLDGYADPNVRTQWKNLEYHEIITRARMTFDKEERIRLYKRAQEIIHEEVPLINVAHSLVIWPMQKKVMNYKLHPTGSVFLKRVWLAE
ncbi:ABC transporter substrate-binding protein [Thermodesulforhabdus norvegica]|uniref:Peptide/nickel transport system substrate-binding protein n=1 Tax=Thermodesulforhabdus norvegica TaxID=39841 RepID=A0A1I4VS94_9BACT|nr:ABC transporter substrate-binding protein [Thermodesulforhabdus norvegica]SFN03967.1 peptide/nickel transport system substrate-binding protein [Thermodesulforhabdus norvegica]